MSAVTVGLEPFPETATRFRVQAVEGIGPRVALVMSSGGATLQTYATRDELRALGEMLLQHANENEVLEVDA